MTRPYRFTPTRVGKTTAGSKRRPAHSVHPHTRGEDASRNTSRRSESGSPPHAWGRLPKYLVGQVAVRFTPTRVGKTGNTIWLSYPPSVHPHTRGEDLCVASTTTPAPGSPPHAWGRPARDNLDVYPVRF